MWKYFNLENKAISNPIHKLLIIVEFALCLPQSLWFLKSRNYYILIIEYFPCLFYLIII